MSSVRVIGSVKQAKDGWVATIETRTAIDEVPGSQVTLRDVSPPFATEEEVVTAMQEYEKRVLADLRRTHMRVESKRL